MVNDKVCEARQYAGGQMHCAKCRMTWDANDSDPPSCPVLTPPAAYFHSEPERLPFATGLPFNRFR